MIFKIPDNQSVQPFANAFENAIHACVQLPQPDDRYISLKLYEKTGSCA